MCVCVCVCTLKLKVHDVQCSSRSLFMFGSDGEVYQTVYQNGFTKLLHIH